MGTRLIEEVLDHAPDDLTPAERMILVVLARHADKHTRECWPSPETIARQAGIKPESVSKALQRLAKRGIELRMPVGKDKHGRPVFAHKGHKTTYRLPVFTQSPDSGPTFKGGQSPDESPTNDTKPGQESGLTASKAGQPSLKGRTTVRQSPDHGPALTVNERSENQLPKDSSSPAAREGDEDDDPLATFNAATETREHQRQTEDLTAFGAFWIAYPKKRDREEALKEWRAAVARGADPAHIVAAATAYARERHGQEPRFTKYPATWLHKGCYDDEPDPQPEPGRPPLRAVSGGYQPFRNPENHDVYDEPLI